MKTRLSRHSAAVRARIGRLTAYVFLAGICACGGSSAQEPDPGSAEATVAGPFRILRIMSYHESWEWNEDQFRGFKDALSGVDVQYSVFEMDAKRRSSKEWLAEASRQARRLIEEWKPDLVFLNDDLAMEYVAVHYLNTEVPIVFSAVNKDPATYGVVGSRNITGVLEQEHFLETVRLLVEIVPEVKRVAVVLDDDPTWDGVTERMKARLSELPPGVSIVRWDEFGTFEAYKRAIERYPSEVDAIATLGIFTFKDDAGENVPHEAVLRWTAEHSQLPDFSFWASRVPLGTLAAVSVSGYEQGLAAGRIARNILVDGVSPSEIAIEPTVRGEPVISLARAQRLGIDIDSSLLLSADVQLGFTWDEADAVEER